MTEYIHGGDVYRNRDVRLDFSVNLNPFGMPKEARRAAAESLSFCDRYPDSRAEALRAGLSSRYRIPGDRIVFGTGAAELIFRLVYAIRPRAAVLLDPSFAEYEAALSGAGVPCSFFPLREENGFRVDVDAYLHFLKNCLPDGGMCFLCNPSNPVGTLLSGTELNRILDFCEERGIFAVTDECFLEFVDHWEQYTALPRVRRGDKKLAVLNAPTKTFSMAGLRIGYAFLADEALIGRLEAAGQPWCLSILAQAAGAALFADPSAGLRDSEPRTDIHGSDPHAGNCEADSGTGIRASEPSAIQKSPAKSEFSADIYLKETRAFLAAEKVFLREGLSECGFTVYGSEANFLFFRDRRERAEYALSEYLLKRGILIRSCGNYRGLDGHYYRICVRKHEENEVLLMNMRDYQ